MSPVIADAPHWHPGSLIVRSYPANDFHIDHASWDDIARLMRGQEFSFNNSPFSIAFQDATIAKSAYDLAHRSVSSTRSAENGLSIEGPSAQGSILSNIALPALRDTVAERLASGASVSLDLVLVGLLQFVPADERHALLNGYANRSSVEDSIALSQNALANRSTPAENCPQLLETSDEIIAWTHNVKSHQIMVAHLCSPTEGAEVRKSAYVMNEILSARKSTPAFQRIANRGAVLEAIGR
jgi:hypothetical protein